MSPLCLNSLRRFSQKKKRALQALFPQILKKNHFQAKNMRRSLRDFFTSVPLSSTLLASSLFGDGDFCAPREEVSQDFSLVGESAYLIRREKLPPKPATTTAATTSGVGTVRVLMSRNFSFSSPKDVATTGVFGPSSHVLSISEDHLTQSIL